MLPWAGDGPPEPRGGHSLEKLGLQGRVTPDERLREGSPGRGREPGITFLLAPQSPHLPSLQSPPTLLRGHRLEVAEHGSFGYQLCDGARKTETPKAPSPH